MKRRLMRAVAVGGAVGALCGFIEAAIWLSRISWWLTELRSVAVSMGLSAAAGVVIGIVWALATARTNAWRVSLGTAGAVLATIAYLDGGLNINSSVFPQVRSASSLVFNAIWMLAWVGVLVGLYRWSARPDRPRIRITWLRPVAAGLAAFGVVSWLSWSAHGSPAAPSATSGPQRPNVLLIVMDTTRAGHLSCYGYPHPTTPNLDHFAAEGALFERATAPAPWTLPSHGSLFTGLYPSQHGARWSRYQLDEQLTTLAELLHAAGYQTVGFSNNGWVSRAINFDQGFEEFHDFQVSWRSGWAADRLALARLIKRVYSPKQLQQDAGATRTNRAVDQWLRDYAGQRPFFIFINYLEPHFEYKPPAAFRRKFVSPAEEALAPTVDFEAMRHFSPPVRFDPPTRQLLTDLYDGELAYLDSRVGEVLDGLRRRHLLDHTLVIVTSDHGESIGDHALFEHQFGVYEAVTHIPLIMRYPARVPAGARVAGRVSLVDVMPTVLAVTGVASPTASALPGRSLLDTLAGVGSRTQPIITEYEAPLPMLDRFRLRQQAVDERYFRRGLRCIYEDPYKLILSSDGLRELYDLSHDPEETTNLAALQPEVAQRMEGDLTQYAATLHPAAAPERVEALADDVRKELRALGYVQ